MARNNGTSPGIRIVGQPPTHPPPGACWGWKALNADAVTPSNESPIGMAVVFRNWIAKTPDGEEIIGRRTFTLLSLVSYRDGTIVGYTEKRRVRLPKETSFDAILTMASQATVPNGAGKPPRVRQSRRRRKTFVLKPVKICKICSFDPDKETVAMIIATHHSGERHIVFSGVHEHNGRLHGRADGLNLRLKLSLVWGDPRHPAPEGFTEMAKAFRLPDGSKPRGTRTSARR